MRNISVNFFLTFLWPVVQEWILFEHELSTFSSSGHFVQRSMSVCDFFCGGHCEEHVCETIIILGQWFMRRYRLDLL